MSLWVQRYNILLKYKHKYQTKYTFPIQIIEFPYTFPIYYNTKMTFFQDMKRMVLMICCIIMTPTEEVVCRIVESRKDSYRL